MKMYQFYKRVGFVIIDTNDQVLTRERISPLFAELQKRLREFRARDTSLNLWVTDVDDLTYYFVEPIRVEGSLRLNIEVRDEIYDGSADRYNRMTISGLNQLLSQLSVTQNGMNLEVKF